MDKNIKISIIIPVYNTSKYLEKCITSISNQSLREIEIICVNDGSMDGSLEILEKIAQEDERIKIINKKNEGPSKARNAALKIAKGKYCLNIDSDDWIEQDYLKDMYEKAEKDNLDILISDIIYDYSNKKKAVVVKDLKISDTDNISGKEYAKRFFTVNAYGYTCNKLIRSQLYIENKIFYNEKIFLLEDVEVLLKLAYFSKKIGKLNKAYYHYIQGENNGSTKIKVSRLYDIMISLNNLIDFYTEKKEFKIVELIKQDKLIHLMNRILSNDYFEVEEYKSFVLKFIKEIKKEKKIIFKVVNKNEKYKIFLIFIIKIIRNIPIKFDFYIIKYIKYILFFRKKIKLLV